MPVYNSTITKNNIDKLKLLWQIKTHSYVTAEPLFYNGKIFTSDWQGYIYCINAFNGKLLYEKQLYQPPKQKGWIRRIPLLKKYFGEPLPYMWNGFAGTGCISDGIWFLASVGGKEGGILTNGAPGKLYAINTQDGRLLWESELGQTTYSGSLAVPVCDDTTVYAAICSCEEIVSVVKKYLLRHFTPECTGEVFAFNKYTGAKRWSRKTVGLDPSDLTNAKGAGVWGGLELHKATQTIFFATGNSYGRPVSKSSDAVISVNSINGNLRWIFQAVAGDAWLPVKKDGPDYDFGCTPILFPCRLSHSNNAVGAGNKNGYFYALDSKSGKLIWKTFCHVSSTPDDGIRSNATYLDGKLYVWSKNEKPKNTMSICCLNAENGTLIWNTISDGTNNMTTGAITNNLYFLANYSGKIFALDIQTGATIWSNTLQKASIGSNLAIYNNRIYAGTGVPLLYNGRPDICGVFSYGFS